MFNNTFFLLILISVLVPVVSGIVYFLDNKLKNRISYANRQIIIGIIFGALAVLGTEWDVSYDGFGINCRDAAVLSAGLLFGGPAGIIAGCIGGIERYIAVAWGAGAYTQIACSLSTLLAGFFAAAIKRFISKGSRPNLVIACISGLVMESFHIIVVFITHWYDASTALNVILICAPPMLICNSISVMLSTIVVNSIDHGRIKIVSKEKKSINESFQTKLLICFIVAFAMFSGLGYLAETFVCSAANKQYLEQNLSNFKEIDLINVANGSKPSADNESGYRKIGDTGYIILSQLDDGKIVSAPNSILGKKMQDIGLKDEGEINLQSYSGDNNHYSYMYDASVNGVDCECMDSFVESYRLTAVYPVMEGYIDRDRATILNLLIQILLFFVIFMLTDIIVRKYVISPIHSINKSLQKITDGDLSTVIDVRPNLEFVQLSDGINKTVDSLQKYSREAQDRIKKELELAQNIQHAALPKYFPPYPDRTEFDIYACMDTAKEVGGDFYDFYFDSQNTFHFLVADVSGKGIPAAMFMMRAKTQLKDLAETGIKLDAVIKRINEQLCIDNKLNMFVTLWHGSIDLNTGLVTYVNAGHNSPIICRSNGSVEFIEDEHDFVLGAFDETTYSCQNLQLKPGDSLYLYTDGVTEAMTDNHELFGEDRLKISITNANRNSMNELCESVKEDVVNFVQDAPQADDITMLAFQYNGKNNEDFLTLPAKKENTKKVIDFAADKLKKQKAEKNNIRDICVAVDEIFHNIASYAYVDSEGDVEIRIRIEHVDDKNPSKRIINMTFVDKGIEFNPLEKKQPDLEADILDRLNGGYGLFIVKEIMDNIEYRREDNKNILTMQMSFIVK